jgi:hypothetical protein
MSKYELLRKHLSSQSSDFLEMSFDLIENILNFRLPVSARKYQAWWSNGGHSQSQAWTDAGWKAQGVDLQSETVRFVKSSEEITHSNSKDDEFGNEVGHGLTIHQAKEGLALKFGVPLEAIEIIIRV